MCTLKKNPTKPYCRNLSVHHFFNTKELDIHTPLKTNLCHICSTLTSLHKEEEQRGEEPEVIAMRSNQALLQICGVIMSKVFFICKPIISAIKCSWTRCVPLVAIY